MLLNPVVKPEARALLIAQRQLVQATVMQMQLAGMGPSNAVGNANGHRQAGPGQHMNGQQQNQQANMGMQGMMMPDMGMGMGMNMNMNMMGNMSGMAVPNQMQQMQQMQQMEQMMMMNMGNMGNMGDAAMQNMQGQGMGGMTPNAQHGNNFPQGGGGNFGPGVRGGRGGFPRGGPALGLRGRGRGRGGMAMGMGMGMGHNMHQGPGHAQGPTGIKRGMEEAFDGGPEGKMARWPG
jgi:protein MPE1